MADEFSNKPYTPWLESVIRDLVGIDPVCVAMQMRDEGGKVYTCYWNVCSDDRAILIAAMREDEKWDWLRNNRDEIMAILNGEEDDEDGLCETDTETDCEG